MQFKSFFLNWSLLLFFAWLISFSFLKIYQYENNKRDGWKLWNDQKLAKMRRNIFYKNSVFFWKISKTNSKNWVMTVAPLYLNLLTDVAFQHVVSYLSFHVGPPVVGFQVLVHLGTTRVHDKLGVMCFLQNLPFNHLVVRNIHTLSHN